MRWIKYQILQSTIGEENILINKKIGYSTENVAIAQKEAYNGEYTVVEDSTDFTKEPIPIEEGGTGATTAEQARENLGVSEAIPDMTAEELIDLTDFEEGTPDNIIPKATKSLLGCVVVGDGLEVDDNAVLSANHMIKLWENASPKSSFAPQSVKVDLSGYSGIGIEFGMSTNALYKKIVMCSLDSYPVYPTISYGFGASNSLVCYYRTIAITDSSTITFNQGWRAAYSYDVSDDNGTIPLRIYGIKGVK